MLFTIWAYYTHGCVCEVVFFDRDAADAWVRIENDKVGADLYEIIEVAYSKVSPRWFQSWQWFTAN
jgi:hypothetical protein